MTTSAKHTHTIQIDAPVEKVFGYIEDPGHFINAMPEDNNTVLGEVNQTPDGAVASYECKFRQLGLHMTALFTREQYVPNERIVDHSSMGVKFLMSVEPGATGTTLTYAYDSSRLMKMIDAAFFHGDKHIETALAQWKREIEALP